MEETFSTLAYLPLVAFSLLVCHQLGDVLLAQQLASAAAARAACTAQRSLEPDGGVRAGVEESARISAAQALWPDAAPVPGAPDPVGTGALDDLSRRAGVTMNAPFGAAVVRTTVGLHAGRPGAWRALRSGDRVDPSEDIRATVEWAHPLRADPSLRLFGAWSIEVRAEARVPAGGGC